MEPLQKEEKDKQENKNKSILSDKNILKSKKEKNLDNEFDFHTQIVNKIDFFLRKSEEKTKSDIINEEPLVEIRSPLNKKIETPVFHSPQNQDSYFYKHVNIPEEFKTDFHTFDIPSFKFVSTLESTDEVLKVKKPKDQHIEIIDLASFKIDSGAIKREVGNNSIVKKDKIRTKNKKIEIVDIKKLGDNNMIVASASNEESESKSDKTNIYYMKSKSAYEKNGTQQEKEHSYIPVDLDDKQKKLKEKEQQAVKKQKETTSKNQKKEDKKQKKEEKKQQKIDEKNRKIEEKLRKKEEKKALIEELKRQAEEKKRLKKQSKKGYDKEKVDDDVVQFVESKPEKVMMDSKSLDKTVESSVDEILAKDRNTDVEKQYPKEKLADKDDFITAFETNFKESYSEDQNKKEQSVESEESVDYEDDVESDEPKLEEVRINDNIKKIQRYKPPETLDRNNSNESNYESDIKDTFEDEDIKQSPQSKPEDVLADKEIKKAYEETVEETLTSKDTIKEVQNAKPEEALVDPDVIKVLLIADNLLGHLPEDVINRFVKSEDFKLYEKVIRKYKNK